MMDADSDETLSNHETSTKTISLKRPDPNIPLRLYYADLKNKRRERFSSEDPVKKTKVSKLSMDSDLQQKRQIRFSENSPKEVSKINQNSSETFKQRQIRFSENPSTNNKISNEDLLDSLKKRRERFGEVTSTLLKKIEVKEKVLQRKARFGQPAIETTETISSTKSQKKKIVF